MEEYFESVLLEAILRCDGMIFIDSNKNKMGFWQIYPFTTENINGYIRYFDLDKKSLLTVGSSADQIINARLFNCSDITVVDINSYTKFYYYLKASCIINLEYNDYCDFFCYRDYPKYCKNNKNVFSKELYEKVKSTFRLLDYDSYLFWDELFNTYDGENIRKEIFEYDEYMLDTLKCTNLYMGNVENFKITKEKLKNFNPKFIISNIFDLTLDKKLNDNGKLLMCYLYDCYENAFYCEDWKEIYNLEKVFNYIKDYNYEFINFTGIRDIIFKNNNSNDAMILIKKK